MNEDLFWKNAHSVYDLPWGHHTTKYNETHKVATTKISHREFHVNSPGYFTNLIDLLQTL